MTQSKPKYGLMTKLRKESGLSRIQIYRALRNPLSKHRAAITQALKTIQQESSANDQLLSTYLTALSGQEQNPNIKSGKIHRLPVTKIWFHISEAAQVLDRDEQTIKRWIKSGKIKDGLFRLEKHFYEIHKEFIDSEIEERK